MAKKLITLPFPAAGLDRSRAYGEQPGLTTLDCENVRPQASNEDRQRGGRRPGLAPQFLMRDKNDVTLSDKIRMANQVRYVAGTSRRRLVENMNSDLGAEWVAAVWPSYNGDAPLIATPTQFPFLGAAYVGSGLPDGLPDSPTFSGGVTRVVPTPWDKTKPYTITVRVFPNTESSTPFNGVFEIPFFLNEGAPDWGQAGWLARTDMALFTNADPPFNRICAQLFPGPIGTDPSESEWLGYLPDNAPVDLILRVDPSGLIEFSIDGTVGAEGPLIQPWNITFPGAGNIAGHRWGFGIKAKGPAFDKQFVDRVTFEYTEFSAADTQESRNKTILVAGCNGKVLREGDVTIFLDQVPGSEDDELSNGSQISNRQLQSVEYGGKLYIADHEFRTSAATGSTYINSDAAQFTITETDNPIAINVEHDLLVVTGPFDQGSHPDLRIGVYDITATVNNGGDPVTHTITVDRAIVAGTTQYTNAEYRIERAGKVFDPAADTVVKWIQSKWDKDIEGAGSPLSFGNGLHPWLNDSTHPDGDHLGPKGSIPTGTPAIAVFIDRIWLAGKPEDPHVWYASRQGDPLDWDLGADANDPTAAVAATTTLAGAIPEAITAFVPYGSDYMVISTTSSLWVLRGDPGFGGRIDNLSRTIGILDKFAWARGPSNEMVFLTSNGLYALAPGASSFPVPFSRERLPRELLNIDPAQFSISMAYDQNQQGYSLFLSQGQPFFGKELHWFIDGKTGGFFPTRHGNTILNPLVAFEWTRDDANSIMLVGDLGAKLTSYDDTAVKDVVSEFSDFVLLGPFDLNDGFRDGILTELRADLPRNPSAVNLDWKLAVGDTADEAAQNAFDETWFDTGTFAAGFNPTARVRARGYSAVLRIGTTTTEHSIWAIEQLSAILKPAGKRRVLT